MVQKDNSAKQDLDNCNDQIKNDLNEDQPGIIQHNEIGPQQVDLRSNSINLANNEEFQGQVSNILDQNEEHKIGEDGAIVAPPFEDPHVESVPLEDNRMSLRKPKKNIFQNKLEIIESKLLAS